MARKKNERLIRQAYSDERKAQKFPEKINEQRQQPCTSTRAKSYRKTEDDSYFEKNDQHFVNFNNQLVCMGLMIRNIKGDGNCLFRALNDQIEGHSRNHLQYRAEIVRHMIENRVDFEPFVEDDVPFEKYMDNLSKDGTFGGQDVLVAFARMRKVNIVIHQLNSPLWHINGGNQNDIEVHLSYHNGEHYSSIRKLGDTTETAANIKSNVNSPNFISMQNKNQSYNPTVDLTKDWLLGADLFDDDFDISEKDVILAQQTLVDYHYNVEEAADYLTSLMVVSSSEVFSNSPEKRNEPEKLACENNDSRPLSSPSSSQIQSGAKPKKSAAQTPKKHVSNKERKDLRRRERVQRQKIKSPNAEIDQISEENEIVVVANLGCLNL